MNQLARLVRQVKRVYCTLTAHDWRRVVLTIGESAEGFAQPAVWKPHEICAFCGAAKVEVGFPLDTSSTSTDPHRVYRSSSVSVDDEMSTTVVVEEWV